MRLAILATASAAVFLSACAGTTGGPSAEAQLAPTRGFDTTGTVTFTQKGDGVQVTASVSGLTPGAHGFHIHEKGDCSAPDERMTSRAARTTCVVPPAMYSQPTARPPSMSSRMASARVRTSRLRRARAGRGLCGWS